MAKRSYVNRDDHDAPDAAFRDPPRIDKDDRLRVSLPDNDTKEFRLHFSSANRAFMPSAAALDDFVSRFTAHKKHGTLRLQVDVPCTDCSAQVISRLWPPGQVEFDDDARSMYEYLLLTVAQQGTSMRRAAKYHEHMRCARATINLTAPFDPDWSDEFVQRFPTPPGVEHMPHQRVAVANSLGTDGYGYFMKPGTGKTACVIGVIDEFARRLRASGETRMLRALGVVPKNVLLNWEREIPRFSTVPGQVTALRGSDMNRLNDFIRSLVKRSPENQYTIVLASYDVMTIMLDSFTGVPPWDVLFWDEAHFMKWPRSQRFKTAVKLRDHAALRLVLTGTPVCNTPVDLYSLFELMREGGSGFSSFETFRKFYGVFKVTSEGHQKLIDVQNLPFLRERLARSSLIVTKEEAMPDLPMKQWDVAEVEMTPQQAEYYVQMQERLYLEIKDDLDDSTRGTRANNILTKLLRLAQITSGFVTFDAITDLDTGEEIAPKVIDRIDPNPKLEELLLHLRELEPNEKALVWACWVPDIRTISARLEAEGIDRVEFYGSTKDADRKIAEERFNSDPACRVCVANPAAGGVGLNLLGYDWWEAHPKLETNTALEVFFSQGWSAVQREQAEDRACRRGQRVPVRLLDLCVPRTIDEEIRARVMDKRRMALDVSDLRDVLRRVLGEFGSKL